MKLVNNPVVLGYCNKGLENQDYCMLLCCEHPLQRESFLQRLQLSYHYACTEKTVNQIFKKYSF